MPATARSPVNRLLPMSNEPILPDPYEPKPTLWERRPQLSWGLAVFGLTIFLTVIAFPQWNIARRVTCSRCPRCCGRIAGRRFGSTPGSCWARRWWLGRSCSAGCTMSRGAAFSCSGLSSACSPGFGFSPHGGQFPSCRGHRALVRILIVLGAGRPVGGARVVARRALRRLSPGCRSREASGSVRSSCRWPPTREPEPLRSF